MDTETRQRHQELTTLAVSAEKRRTAHGITIAEGLSTNGLGWIADVGRLDAAKTHFSMAHFDRAEHLLRQLLDDVPADEAPLFRARCLRLIADCAMGQAMSEPAKLNEAAQWLSEAEQICEKQRDPYQLGQVYRSQGALALWREAPDEASELIAIGERLEKAFTPRWWPAETPATPQIATS